ncbi:MAG: hypothetical protein NUV77_22770 [Thermoguttaceae bacterium]|nr:hypothetical protein [Thermoguttaceae bacterium]
MNCSLSSANQGPLVPRGSLKTVVLILASATLLIALRHLGQAAAPSTPAAVNPSESAQTTPARTCLREGTQIVDQWGYFKPTGERWLFVAEREGAQWVGLENRNLERVARAVAGNPRRLRWRVTGILTEYHGSNFLLIERAILKSDATQPQGG